MSAISIKQLLEAGVHFGHQTHRWNPKMKDYIFGERNGIYIIDLQQTLRMFKEAVDFVSAVTAQGRSVLFVGTKRQAQEAVEEEAVRCGMFFVNNRWLGGLLTNFSTIQNSIKRYKELDTMRAEGFYSKLSKKEAARLERERKKLEKNLRGIRDMDRLPGAIFVIDSNREEIAVREANKLNIPVVAIVDTNSDPSGIDYVIPGNDDALRALRLFTSTIAEAIIAGRSVYDAKVEAELREAREKAAKEAAQRRAERKAREEAERAKKEAAAAAAAAQEVGEKQKKAAEAVETSKQSKAKEKAAEEEAEVVAEAVSEAEEAAPAEEPAAAEQAEAATTEPAEEAKAKEAKAKEAKAKEAKAKEAKAEEAKAKEAKAKEAKAEEAKAEEAKAKEEKPVEAAAKQTTPKSDEKASVASKPRKAKKPPKTAKPKAKSAKAAKPPAETEIPVEDPGEEEAAEAKVQAD